MKGALDLASTKEIQIAVAMALARIGETSRSQATVTDLAKNFPEDTLLQRYWLPAIRAAIAIQQKRVDNGIDALQVAAPFELGGGTPPFSSGATLYPAYLRGEAYLANRKWDEAVREFQKFQRHRGLVWNLPLAALSWLQLGRAYAGSGDKDKARSAYQAFLYLWRDADPGTTLRAANLEYARLH